MRLRDLILDTWTAISYKEALSPSSNGSAALAPSWVGPDNQRRLAAYKMLQAYQDNAARHFMPSKSSQKDRDDRREYGDAALIVGVVLGALLGDDQSIVVDGADDDPPEGSPEGTVTPEAERQDWLTRWAADERLPLKMIETERNAIGLADGVYYVAWSARKRRPRLRVFDPGWYFPVLETATEDDYPTRVHVAWDEEETPGGKTRVHRITWELAPILPMLDVDGMPLLDEQGQWVLHPGDVLLDDGTIERVLPWHEPGETATVTCYMTEATWTIEALGPRTVDEFSFDRATFAVNDDGQEVRRLDLMVDFVPVVHVPNTVALLNHYGKSVLATVLQLLDDLQLADTDLARASLLAAGPPIALSGVGSSLSAQPVAYSPTGQLVPVGDGNGSSVGYQPMSLWRLPEGGKLDMLDTSRALDAILKYIEFLLKRLSVNSRLPESVLGRVASKDVASGVQLAMMFGPLQQMVAEMRLVRDEKNPLVLKFVQRFALLGGVISGPVMGARIALGSFLPSDRSAVVGEVTALLTAHAISTHTAVGMLIEAGFPIDDAQAEVQRIQEENFAAAVQLADALGGTEQAYEYLGLTPPAGPAPPPITLPNLAGAAGGAGGTTGG